jgi:AraC family transcriptional regulator
MPKLSDYLKYQKRINQVKNYIYEHLDGDLSLQNLAQICFMSPYHFHRIYRAARGETAAETVRRMRMHQAALLLTQSDMPIGKITKDCGYANTQSFTRLFKSYYGKPPASFRNHNKLLDTNPMIQNEYKVEIQSITDLEAIFVAHSSPHLETSPAFDRLFVWLGLSKLETANFHKIRVLMDNPFLTASHLVRSRACILADKQIRLQPPLQVITIPGGEYAVVQHHGPYEKLESLYGWFFTTWLVESKNTLRDSPMFEKYRNDQHTTPPHTLLTDVYFPLQAS